MVDLSKVNKPAIEIIMRTIGMWGLHRFEDLEIALSGWHSSETAEPVKMSRMISQPKIFFKGQEILSRMQIKCYADLAR